MSPGNTLGGRVLRCLGREPAVFFLALRMAAWVIVVSGLARVCSMPRMFRLITPARAGDLRSAAVPPSRVASVLDTILGAGVPLLAPVCWKRAAVLYRYLRLAGYEPQVLLGVRKDAARGLAGHAWIELNGAPAFESIVPDYAVTLRFPPGPSCIPSSR